MYIELINIYRTDCRENCISAATHISLSLYIYIYIYTYIYIYIHIHIYS